MADDLDLDPIPREWIRPEGHALSSGHNRATCPACAWKTGHDRGYENGRIIGLHEAKAAAESAPSTEARDA